MKRLRAWCWEAWRDLTWARDQRKEWLNKMQRYYDNGGRSQTMAIDRVAKLANDISCLDWDDNIPQKWALVLVRRWRLQL